MRLQQYINEATVVSGIQIARKVVESNIDKFYDALKRKDFNVSYEDMIDILDKTFGSGDDIALIFMEVDQPGTRGFGKYIQQGATTPDGSVGVYIFKSLVDYMRTFRTKDESEFVRDNKFLYELEDVISHEYTHVVQYMKRLGFHPYAGTKMVEYFADPDEIGAYAVSIANEIHDHGKSLMLWVYEWHFGPDSKILKKLKRKVVDAMRELGYDNPEFYIKSDRPKGWEKVFKQFKKKNKYLKNLIKKRKEKKMLEKQ
jgi:hypothetical protein